MSGWDSGLMTATMALLCGLLLFGVIAAVRYPAHADRPVAGRPAPEKLLAEWFDRGEINEQDYRQRLEALRGGPFIKP